MGFENYKPSQEENKKAEEIMTSAETMASNERGRNYKKYQEIREKLGFSEKELEGANFQLFDLNNAELEIPQEIEIPEDKEDEFKTIHNLHFELKGHKVELSSKFFHLYEDKFELIFGGEVDDIVLESDEAKKLWEKYYELAKAKEELIEQSYAVQDALKSELIAKEERNKKRGALKDLL